MMNRINFIIGVSLGLALIAALIVLSYNSAMDWLGMAVFVLPTIQIKYCTDCRAYTNHQQKSGDWICRCATIHVRPEIENGVSSQQWFDAQTVEAF